MKTSTIALVLSVYSAVSAFGLAANNPFSKRQGPPRRRIGTSSTPLSSPPRQQRLTSIKETVRALKDKPLSGGTATVSNEIFNLVKAILGAGVLGLPAGIALMGNTPSTIIPAVVLIVVFGVLSGYGFALIGRVCAMTGTTTYRSAWAETISESSSWVPALAVTLKTICATLAYSMILGETFQSLATSSGINVSKAVLLPTLTATVLLPLCLLKNLSSLAPFSLLGSLGMVYTGIAMTIRLLGKSYLKGGKFALDVAAPSFGSTRGKFLQPSTAILLGMLSTAYMAHFNAPKFYTELKNNTIPRYLRVVSTSFGISIAMFGWIAAMGYLTFGGSSAGLILSNYSTKDALMSVSRIAVALSLVFSYPLAFVGARDGVLDLFQIKSRNEGLLNTLTVGILSLITSLALIIPDVSFVLAFAG
jgi:amino acid permease